MATSSKFTHLDPDLVVSHITKGAKRAGIILCRVYGDKKTFSESQYRAVDAALSKAKAEGKIRFVSKTGWEPGVDKNVARRREIKEANAKKDAAAKEKRAKATADKQAKAASKKAVASAKRANKDAPVALPTKRASTAKKAPTKSAAAKGSSTSKATKGRGSKAS